MGKQTTQNYGATLELEQVGGTVHIADDVIAAIAGVACTEVEGVAYMADNMTRELIGRLGIKNLTRGVEISVEEDTVKVTLSIVMQYGYSIPVATRAIQERVKASIEGMTGLTVENVTVHVCGLDIDKA